MRGRGRGVAHVFASLALAAVAAWCLTPVVSGYALYKHEVVWRCRHVDEAVALTFDDGPDPEYTPAVLDILAEHGAHATFFVIGEQAERYPEIIERIIAEGHEIGHHTHRHPPVGELAHTELATEFDDTLAVLRAQGIEPLWYRPPRKELTKAQKRLARERGMRVALWTRCVERAAFSSADEMARTIVTETRPGDILLAHDGRLDRSMTVAALPMLLDGLAQRGIGCVTLSELHGDAR